ncbi:MAG: pyrroline-5-carboxylate reductase [Chloroflexota bacterium]|nr:pyrroline-5-carboxylate reductase [Chloroflexota bacterium]
MSPTIAVIGCGTMGEALVQGLLREGVVPPEEIIAANPRPERGQELAEHYGIRTTTENSTAAEQAELVFLSVKPQVMPQVLAKLQGHIQPQAFVFSIAAGVTIATIQQGLGIKAVVRAMPNTPAQIGEGITVWTATEEITVAQREAALVLLQAMGEEIYVHEESYLNMATALSGTGPAYVFLFMESLIDAGVHLGFSRRVAEEIVNQLVIGSALYAKQAGLHKAALRNQVTSPGGTTAEALYQLEKGGFRTVLSRAVWSAYSRAAQFGKKS